jgi:hypothetical protein
MRFALIVPLAVALLGSHRPAAPPPPGPFEGEIEVSGSMPPFLMKIKGTKANVVDVGGGEVLIFDGAGGVVREFAVNRSRQHYTLATFPDAEASTRTVMRTGRTQIIAGQPCEEIVVTAEDGSRTEACISQVRIFAAVKRPLMEMGGLTYEQELSGGLPLRVAHFDAASGLEYWMQVTRVEAKAIADADFEVPAGFWRMKSEL